MTECYCGTCRRCRLEERLIQRGPIPTQPVQLSDTAKAVLSEPTGTPYVPRRVPSVIQPNSRQRPSRALTAPRHVTPTPCTNCYQMRGVGQAGKSVYGLKVVGEGTLCEVCADIPKITARLDDPSTSRTTASILRLRQGRVLRDGRAYHPDAAHGTGNAYTKYGCRCRQCRDWKTAYAAARLDREAATARQRRRQKANA